MFFSVALVTSVSGLRMELIGKKERERLFCNRLLNTLLIGERISLCYVCSMILVDMYNDESMRYWRFETKGETKVILKQSYTLRITRYWC